MFYISSASEIPQFRLPYDVVSYEVELMKDLGVKVGLDYPDRCTNTAALWCTTALFLWNKKEWVRRGQETTACVIVQGQGVV